MQNFVAIDFETANGKRSSVCSEGVVIVRNGEIVDSFYSLIKPVPNYYLLSCQIVHGLGYSDTDEAEPFPEVWAKLQNKVHAYFPYIEDGEVPFIAHNARFDEGCLRAVFATYQIAYPCYEFRDTLYASRRHISATRWRTTNCTPFPPLVATISKNITMPSSSRAYPLSLDNKAASYRRMFEAIGLL